MRNLKLLTSLYQRLEDLSQPISLTVNYDTGTIYSASEQTVVAFHPTTGEVIVICIL